MRGLINAGWSAQKQIVELGSLRQAIGSGICEGKCGFRRSSGQCGAAHLHSELPVERASA